MYKGIGNYGKHITTCKHTLTLLLLHKMHRVYLTESQYILGDPKRNTIGIETSENNI